MKSKPLVDVHEALIYDKSHLSSLHNVYAIY